MNFSEALYCLRQNKPIKRAAWKEHYLKIERGEIVLKTVGQPDCEMCELDSIDLLALDWYCIE